MARCMAHAKTKYPEKENVCVKKQDEPAQRRRKRNLEVLSFTCSTVGVNMVVGCFCGVPNIFGFKSPDVIFKSAFAFLLASVILGIMAMISSITGYEFLQAPFFSIRKYLLFKLPFFRGTELVQSVDVSAADSEVEKNEFVAAKISKANDNRAIIPICLGDLPRIDPECSGSFRKASDQITFSSPGKIRPSTSAAVHNVSDKCIENPKIIASKSNSDQQSFSTALETNCINQGSPMYGGNSLPFRNYELPSKPLEQSIVPSQWSYKQSEIKDLQLKKRRNSLFFGQCLESDNRSAKDSITFSYEVVKDLGNARIVSLFQGSFMGKVRSRKEPLYMHMRPKETFARSLSVGTYPCSSRNTCPEAGSNYNFPERFFPFRGNFQTPPGDRVSDVTLKLDKMNFLS